MLRPAFASTTAAVLGCLLLAPAALAAGSESTPLNLGGGAAASPGAHATGSGGGMVRTIVGLAVVLGVIFGLHWVLKQVKASKEDRAVGAGLEAVASLPLGANRSLQLVRAGSELVLVGVGESGVTPIRTYAEDEARALGLLEEPDDGDGPVDGRGVGGGLDPLGRRPDTGTPWSRFIIELRRRTVIR